jgi:FkbM family methyltransferase
MGTFVEVGAFDGMTYGCTWGLAKAGWRGVYVEAHPDFAAQCIAVHRAHPNVDTYAVACGEKEGTTELTIYGECSTTVLDKWNREWGMNDQTPKITVPVRTLDSILQESRIQSIDLLVVDVEGAEISVLKGLSMRPKVAVIELHEGQGRKSDQKGFQTPWVDNYFSGYRKIYFDNINTIYVQPKQ